mgnify:CR=1 FL=1
MTAKPATERMAALRKRRQDTGLTRLELWAHPDDHQAIRDEAARLAKARNAAANVEVQRDSGSIIAGGSAVTTG